MVGDQEVIDGCGKLTGVMIVPLIENGRPTGEGSN